MVILSIDGSSASGAYGKAGSVNAIVIPPLVNCDGDSARKECGGTLIVLDHRCRRALSCRFPLAGFLRPRRCSLLQAILDPQRCSVLLCGLRVRYVLIGVRNTKHGRFVEMTR